MKPILAILAAATASMGLSAPALAVDLVTNGGFESGSFSGWTQTGDTAFNGVGCPGPSPGVQSGNCAAFFGPIGTTGGISQTLSTVAGEEYAISFWLQPDGGQTSSFQAFFDGGSLTLLLNPPASAYTLYSFLVNASTNSTTLAFSFRDDPGFLLFDSVSVVATAGAVPEPSTWALMLVGFGAIGFAMRRRNLPELAFRRAT